jgi:hypothetical protein
MVSSISFAISVKLPSFPFSSTPMAFAPGSCLEELELLRRALWFGVVVVLRVLGPPSVPLWIAGVDWACEGNSYTDGRQCLAIEDSDRDWGT